MNKIRYQIFLKGFEQEDNSLNKDQERKRKNILKRRLLFWLILPIFVALLILLKVLPLGALFSIISLIFGIGAITNLILLNNGLYTNEDNSVPVGMNNRSNVDTIMGYQSAQILISLGSWLPENKKSEDILKNYLKILSFILITISIAFFFVRDFQIAKDIVTFSTLIIFILYLINIYLYTKEWKKIHNWK